MPPCWTQSEPPAAANRRSLFQSNSNFRATRLHCFPPRQHHIPCCLSVRLPVHFGGCLSVSCVHLSVHSGCMAKAAPLTSGTVVQTSHSIHSDPSREEDNWQFTSTSQFVHFWNWPWTLLSHRPHAGEDWIHNDSKEAATTILYQAESALK